MFILLLFLVPVNIFAAFYGNQSGVNWKSAETQHFLAHYPAQYREQAAKATEIAEGIYDTLTNRYNIKLPSKVNLVINNSLYSNGEANPVYNMMQIFLTGWDFKIRGTHRWVKNVVTHEFSHLASMQKRSLTPYPWIQGIQISKSDFFNEKNQLSMAAYIPFMVQPLWLAEGTAQYESYRMGFDKWDTHRDMILRTAFLENKVLPLEFMEDFSEQALEAEQGPYTQGFDMVRYIAQTYGDSTLPKMWNDMDAIGISEKELYKNWLQNRKEYYEKVRISIGEINVGKKLSKGSFYNDYLNLANGKLYGLSNFSGDFFEGDIFEYKDSVPEIFKKFKLKKPFLSQGMSIKQTPKGLLLAYVTYQNRDKTGKPYFDIAVADTNGNNRIITKFADAVYPDISNDGEQIVFARREANGTRFYLSVADMDGNINDILSPTGEEFNIYNPKFSPNDKQIAYSYFDGTNRKIGIKKNATETLSDSAGIFILNSQFSILNSQSDFRDPNWSKDGKSIYFSSDESGIFNIYKKNLETNQITKLTNTLGGAFSPIEKEDSLIYINYDKDGFSIYRMENGEWRMENETFRMENGEWRMENEETNISFANSEHNYSPIPRMPILVPLFALDDRTPNFGAINQGIITPKAGLAIGLNDPLNKNFFQIAALQEIGKFGEDSQSDLVASLENRSLPITLNLIFTRMNTALKDTMYSEEQGHQLIESEYATELYNALISASYSVFKEGDSLSVFASYDKTNYNLYEMPFRFDYQNRIQFGGIAGYTFKDSLFSVQGLYSFSTADLFAKNFREASGALFSNQTNFELHEWAASANVQFKNISLSVFANGILKWNSKADTLDNYYLHPLVIEGYPVLKDSDNFFKQGFQTALAEVRYKFDIYKDLRKRFGFFTTRNFSFSLFSQAGNVWDEDWKRDDWLKSVGIDWTLENRIFYYIPFNLHFGVAQGIDERRGARLKIFLSSN